MSKRKEKITAKCDKCGERMRVEELGDGTFSITCDKCGISENVSRADKRLRTLCEYAPGQEEDEKDTYLGKFVIAFSIIVIFIGIIASMNRTAIKNRLNAFAITPKFYEYLRGETSTGGNYFVIPDEIR